MMKKNLFLLCILLLTGSCKVYEQSLPTNCTDANNQGQSFNKADELISLFEEVVSKGVPGIAAAVYTDQGWWQHASGLAQIEGGLPMQNCHLHYLQSIAKTYQAVAIMKLYEEGKIDLDAPITNYLKAEHQGYVKRANEITVRMLLNHSSGIPDYNMDPGFISVLLQKPDKLFTTPEYLEVIKGKALVFEPGSRYSYCNMNYELLSLIADAITGDHARHITEVIFTPLGLNNTFYRDQTGYLTYPQLYNSYWDRHGDGILENVSQMQRTNVASMIGDDGIVSTPKDAVAFLKGLFEGKLISAESLELMKEGFVQSDGSIEYGLGLDHAQFAGKPALGHSGGGIGAGCQLYYVPETDTYFFIGVNLGTITEGPIQDEVASYIEKIHEVLLSDSQGS